MFPCFRTSAILMCLQDNSLRPGRRRLSLFSIRGEALSPRVPLLSYSNARWASSAVNRPCFCKASTRVRKCRQRTPTRSQKLAAWRSWGSACQPGEHIGVQDDGVAAGLRRGLHQQVHPGRSAPLRLLLWPLSRESLACAATPRKESSSFQLSPLPAPS